MARWIALRALAFALRPHKRIFRQPLDNDQAAAAIASAFPHRDNDWRLELLRDARRRAAARGT